MYAQHSTEKDSFYVLRWGGKDTFVAIDNPSGGYPYEVSIKEAHRFNLQDARKYKDVFASHHRFDLLKCYVTYELVDEPPSAGTLREIPLAEASELELQICARFIGLDSSGNTAEQNATINSNPSWADCLVLRRALAERGYVGLRVNMLNRPRRGMQVDAGAITLVSKK